MNHHRLRNALAWLLLASLLAFHLHRGLAIYWQRPGFTRFGQVDFNVYYAAASLLERGQNPYEGAATASLLYGEGLAYLEGSNYLYPPYLAAVLIPLTMVPPLAAGFVWYLLGLASLVGAVLLLLHGLGTPGEVPTLSRPWCLVLALAFAPAGHSLYVGQVNSVLLLLLTAALLAWRRVQEEAAGAWIAAAALLKVAPILLLLPLALLGRWRSVAAALAVIIGAVTMTIPFVGHLLAPFWHTALSRLEPPQPHPVNQSLHGFWSRALTESPFTVPLVDGGPWLVRAAVLASGGALTIAVLARIWKHRMALARRRDGLVLALPVTLVPILSPLAWESLYLILLLPGFLLARRWHRLPVCGRPALIGSLLLIQAQRLWDPFTAAPAQSPWLRLAWPLMSLALYGALLLLWLQVELVKSKDSEGRC